MTMCAKTIRADRNHHNVPCYTVPQRLMCFTDGRIRSVARWGVVLCECYGKRLAVRRRLC